MSSIARTGRFSDRRSHGAARDYVASLYSQYGKFLEKATFWLDHPEEQLSIFDCPLEGTLLGSLRSFPVRDSKGNLIVELPCKFMDPVSLEDFLEYAVPCIDYKFSHLGNPWKHPVGAVQVSQMPTTSLQRLGSISEATIKRGLFMSSRWGQTACWVKDAASPTLFPQMKFTRTTKTIVFYSSWTSRRGETSPEQSQLACLQPDLQSTLGSEPGTHKWSWSFFRTTTLAHYF